MPESRERLPGLDTLRATAILLVIAFHLSYALPQAMGPFLQFAWVGVDLFFVLSGYLIGSQALRSYSQGKQFRAWDFYKRRAYRILPAYCTVLLLYFTWPLWRESLGISPLWEFASFTQNLLIDYIRHRAFSQAWSLCVEEHFYLFLPLILFWMFRKPSFSKTTALFALLVLSGILIRTFVLIHYLRPLGVDDPRFAVTYLEKVYYPTYTRLDGLLTGVTLALIQIFRPQWWNRIRERGHMLLCSGVALVCIAAWLFLDRFDSVTGVAATGTIVGFPILSLGFGLIVASAISKNGWLSRFSIPGAKTIAVLAFSLYLTHKEVVHLVQHFFPNFTDRAGWLPILAYAVCCFAVAATLYLLIERPFLLLRDFVDGRHSRSIEEQMRNDPAI
jgi:peptidoglycan/LPS O-acetylase OafA/YrhL